MKPQSKESMPSLEHAHWWVCSAQISLTLPVTPILEPRAHHFFLPTKLPLPKIGVELAGEGHFHSKSIFRRANSIFPLNRVENMGLKGINLVANPMVH